MVKSSNGSTFLEGAYPRTPMGNSARIAQHPPLSNPVDGYDHLRFSGTRTKKSGFKKFILRPLSFLSSALVLMGVGRALPASASGVREANLVAANPTLVASNPEGTVRTDSHGIQYRELPGDIPAGNVRTAQDFRNLNPNDEQYVIDQKGDNHLFSQSARDRLENLLAQCDHDPNCGNNKVVVVSNSDAANLTRLAQELADEMGLGERGTVILINREHLLNDTSVKTGNDTNGRLAIRGDAFDNIIERSGRDGNTIIKNLIMENAAADITAAKQARDRGDYRAAQELIDNAIGKTVAAYEQMLVDATTGGSGQNPVPAPDHFPSQPSVREPEGEPIDFGAIARGLGNVLLLLGYAGATIGAGAITVRLFLKRQARIQEANKIPAAVNEAFHPNLNVSRQDVFTVDTLQKMLESVNGERFTAKQNTALESVLGKLPADDELKTVLKNSLASPSPAVRSFAVSSLYEKFQHQGDLSHEFVTQLSIEQDRDASAAVGTREHAAVIDVLGDALKEMRIAPDDLTVLADMVQNSSSSAARGACAEIIANSYKLTNNPPTTIQVLLDALSKETDATTREIVENSLLHAAEKQDGETLLNHLSQSRSADVRKSVLTVLAKIKDPSIIGRLAGLMERDNTPTLKDYYTKALTASLSGRGATQLFDDLENAQTPTLVSLLSKAILATGISANRQNREFLSGLLESSRNGNVRATAAARLANDYGVEVLETLYNGLESSTGLTPAQTETFKLAIGKASTKVGKDQIEFLLTKAHSANATVKALATPAVTGYVEKLGTTSYYNKTSDMNFLHKLSKDENPAIKKAALSAIDSLVAGKVAEITTFANKKAYNEKYYTELIFLSENAREEKIQQKAKQAIKMLEAAWAKESRTVPAKETLRQKVVTHSHYNSSTPWVYPEKHYAPVWMPDWGTTHPGYSDTETYDSSTRRHTYSATDNEYGAARPAPAPSPSSYTWNDNSSSSSHRHHSSDPPTPPPTYSWPPPPPPTPSYDPPPPPTPSYDSGY